MGRAEAIAVAESLIGLRSTVNEVETVLKANNLMADWDYARDAHFQRYVLRHITTDDQLDAFLVELDSESDRDGCTKVRRLRSTLTTDSTSDFWNESLERKLHIFATYRRTCCGCHLTGSFTKQT